MRMQKPGLCLPYVKVESQDVKSAHRKVCFNCSSVPKDVRLKVNVGTGRSGVTRIYCAKCGSEFSIRRANEFAHLVAHLSGKDVTVRLYPFTKLDPSYRESTAGKNLRSKQKKPRRPLPSHIRGIVSRKAKSIDAC